MAAHDDATEAASRTHGDGSHDLRERSPRGEHITTAHVPSQSQSQAIRRRSITPKLDMATQAAATWRRLSTESSATDHITQPVALPTVAVALPTTDADLHP